MGFFDKILNVRGNRFILDETEFASRIVSVARAFMDDDDHPRFSQESAYFLACTLAEINFPIDQIADKVATLKFSVQNESGKIVERLPKSVDRLITRPNVFCSFSQMVYDAVFILLSDGNLVAARNKPSLFSDSDFTPENIKSVNLLYPGSYHYRLNTELSHLFADRISDMVRAVDYDYANRRIVYEPGAIEILGSKGQPDNAMRYPSPLQSVSRNIENLIVVYQARYRAYTKNGMGMLISPKGTNIGTNAAAVVNNSVDRDRIVRDILKRYGVSGENGEGRQKLLWGVSGVAIDAVKTLATISELQPFDETREDALQIAGAFSVDKDLLPSKDGTTFTNKEAAEAGLYTGPVYTMAKDVFEFLTKLMRLDKIGLKLVPDLENIPVLQKQRVSRADADSKVVDLIVKMRENGLATDQDVQIISEKIIKNYIV
jgi:hypothetical protein